MAGNGPLQPPPEQTEMMNSDVFACQQLVPTSSVQRPPVEPERCLRLAVENTDGGEFVVEMTQM